MIYINGNPDGLSDVEIGEDYIKHSTGIMTGVHFENIVFTDDSEGVEIRESRLKFIRKKRDELLSKCDYLVLPDYPIDETELSLWNAYRQSLRDMPETVDLDNVVWPVAPNEQETEVPTEPPTKSTEDPLQGSIVEPEPSGNTSTESQLTGQEVIL